ncbi:hypothetical protein R83H12_03009 [Fibrobacteria bacterium R8-3-H12]
MSEPKFTECRGNPRGCPRFSCSIDESGDENGGNENGGSENGGGGGGSFNCSLNGGSVRIGTQVWMKENLNCNVSGSKCYNNNSANCTKYGRLYDWETATKVCPKGWHLPSYDEWRTLLDYLAGDEGAGRKLTATSGWNYSVSGTNTSGFSALPGGYGGSDGSFFNVGSDGGWWSSSKNDANYAYLRLMDFNYERALWGSYDKSYLFSVRCVQDY